MIRRVVIAVLPWLGRSVFCAGGHDVFKHSVECFKCSWDSSMLRVGRVDGAFLVCVIDVDRALALVPIDSVEVASSVLLCFDFVVRF